MAGARGAKGTTRFLLVLTDRSVVTLSTAGRARISLKHGLDAPNPDDLVLLPPVLFYLTECIGGRAVAYVTS